jgi:hypothetical protein
MMSNNLRIGKILASSILVLGLAITLWAATAPSQALAQGSGNNSTNATGNGTAAGGLSLSENQTALVPNTNASLIITPQSVQPGGNLFLAGSGFGKSQQVTFMLDNATQNSIPPAKTDAAGTFLANATLPSNVTQGGHTISAKNESNVTATARFNVEAPSGK